MVCWQARSFPRVSLLMLNAFKGCRQVVLSAGTWQLRPPSQTPCAQPQDSETASLATQMMYYKSDAMIKESGKLGRAGVHLSPSNTSLRVYKMCVASRSFWDKMMKWRSAYMILLFFQLTWPKWIFRRWEQGKWLNCLVVKTHFSLLLSVKLRNGRKYFHEVIIAPWISLKKKKNQSMPNESENVPRIRVESIDMFNMTSRDN